MGSRYRQETVAAVHDSGARRARVGDLAARERRLDARWRADVALEATMRRAATSVLIAGVTTVLAAQTVRTPLPAPGTNKALFMKASEVQDLIKAYPGGNAQIKSIDAGKHVVDFWLE